MANSVTSDLTAEKAQLDRHLFTWTINNFTERANRLLSSQRYSAEKIHCTNLPIGYSKEIGFNVAMAVSSLEDKLFDVTFSLQLTDDILSVNTTNSILNSDNEVEFCTEYSIIPKHELDLAVDHEISMANLLNDKDKLLPNDALTLICEVELFYKFYAQNSKGITIDYINNLNASIVSDMSYNIKSLFEKKLNCDVEIHCDGAVFQAHKTILSAQSVVFSKMLNRTRHETKIIHIENVHKRIAKELVNFMYGNDILHKSLNFIVQIFSAASKYEIFDLKRYCSSILSLNLNVDNVCEYAILANKNDDDKLFAAAKTFAWKNYSQLMISKNWIDLVQNSHSVAKRLVS